VVAMIMFGSMVLVEPDYLVPMLRDLCRSCISWEDTDRLAMDGVEPIVRKHPERWIDELAFWLSDTNKWVRRAAITIIGRLPMKHPTYTPQCLAMSETLLTDSDVDVRRAVSFAIRVCAKSDPQLTCTFLQNQISTANVACVWVLSDVIKSMDRKILHQFASLLPFFQDWKERMNSTAKERRSLESVIMVLQNASID
jgi:3-methyladenine DNA glycosylase AlkD